MIKISKKSQYGLRAVVYLAKAKHLAKKRIVCSVREIAFSENIPADFLEKILVSLKKAGLVKVKRGKSGGYYLSGSLKDITVGDVVRSLEKKMALALCLDKNSSFACPQEKKCLTKNVWLKIQNILNQSLDSITIFDLINEER